MFDGTLKTLQYEQLNIIVTEFFEELRPNCHILILDECIEADILIVLIYSVYQHILFDIKSILLNISYWILKKRGQLLSICYTQNFTKTICFSDICSWKSSFTAIL